MEFKFKKNVTVVVNLEIGEEIRINGWGYQLDGRRVIEDIKPDFGKCESGIMIKVKGKWIDSGWADKL